MKRFVFDFVQTVEVTLDPSKFTPEFMEEFRRSFYPFDDVRQHAGHIAQLEARGLIGFNGFIEGYGDSQDLKDLGIKAEVIDSDLQFVEARDAA